MLSQHLEKLRGFHLVATEGSFLQAARLLGISQPALSKNVRILEDLLDVSLLNRHRRGVALTEAGLRLNEFCERLFPEVEDVEQRVRFATKVSGVLRVGTYETLGESFWPHALSHLNKEFPDLSVQLTTHSGSGMWQQLDRGILHMVVDAEPPLSSDYDSRVLYSDRFGLFAVKAKQFPNRVPLAFVQRATDRQGESIAQSLAKASFDYELRYDLESFTIVRALTLKGLCVGVLPLRLATAHLKRGELVVYAPEAKKPLFREHRICATVLQSQRKDPRIVSVIRRMQEIAKEVT
ncbi:MAG: LysR family transcriptional regulator [Bdellovibrionota bacterium]